MAGRDRDAGSCPLKILALDLSRNVGWALGNSDAHPPELGCFNVRKGNESAELAAGIFGRWLRDVLRDTPPDIIAVEDYMQPTASRSQDATIAQLMLHGALHGLAGLKRIKVYPVAAATARKHFCGKAFAMPVVRGHKRSNKEKAEARRATKRMVEERAKQLGYLPRNYQVGASDDRDEADAACVYDWAVAHVARQSELWRTANAAEERDGGRQAVERKRRPIVFSVG